METPAIHGHRGARGNRPENTLAGFSYAAAAGVDGLELDVLVSADDQIVIHHDNRLNSDITRDNSGSWLTEAGKKIRDLTLEELKRFDIGRTKPGTETARRFPDQIPVDGQTISTLTELSRLHATMGSCPPILNIEIKSDPTRPACTPDPKAYARLLMRELYALDLVNNCWIQSFDWRVLCEVQALEPALTTCCLTCRDAGHDTIGKHGDSPWLAGYDPARYGGNTAVAVLAAGGQIWGPSIDDLDDSQVEEALVAGIPIHCWTVNRTRDIQKAIDWGLAGLTTDYPDFAVRVVRGVSA